MDKTDILLRELARAARDARHAQKIAHNSHSKHNLMRSLEAERILDDLISQVDFRLLDKTRKEAVEGSFSGAVETVLPAGCVAYRVCVVCQGKTVDRGTDVICEACGECHWTSPYYKSGPGGRRQLVEDYLVAQQMDMVAGGVME